MFKRETAIRQFATKNICEKMRDYPITRKCRACGKMRYRFDDKWFVMINGIFLSHSRFCDNDIDIDAEESDDI